MTLTDIKDLASIIAVVIAAGTLLKGLSEYSRDAAHKRLQTLVGLRLRFTDSPALQAVRGAIESDKPNALADVSRNYRVDFAALIEEVALLLNSKIISERVAHSMFGFYAIKANESEAFWKGFEREKYPIYWKPFTDFAERMNVFEKANPVFDRSEYKI
jgi:hypothetical protein